MFKLRVKVTSRPALVMAVWVACVGLVSACATSPGVDNDPDDAAVSVIQGDTGSGSKVAVADSSPNEPAATDSSPNESDAGPAAQSPAPESQSAEPDAAAVAPAESDFDPGAQSPASETRYAEVPDHDASVTGVDPDGSERPAEGIAAGTGAAGAAVTAESVAPEEADEPDDGSLSAAGTPEPPPIDPCTQYDSKYDTWLDRSQIGVYRTVCGAAAWFDGFFGDRRFDQVTGETYGRISAGGYWDERNGFDPRLRFRARFALPSLRDRGALLIGRGDEQAIVEERDTARSDQVPAQPSPDGDQDVGTFVGFGWDQLASLTRGLRFSAGLRLRTPPVPIFKIKYRRNWQLTERNLLSFRPLVYWRSDEGLGATIKLDIDHVINSAFLFRWANFANVSEYEEVEGVNWGTTVYLFQALSKKRALTYSIFARGETKAPITFQNTGFEIRYRQNILRKWLFVETNGGVSWPRYLPEEERKANLGIGLRLEAYFGPAPDSWMR